MPTQCPPNYQCTIQPLWTPEQLLPLFGIVATTIVIVALLVVAYYGMRKGNKN